MLSGRVFRSAARAVLLLTPAVQLMAQCPMCRTAAARDPAAARALNLGILLLFIPAVALFSGVFLLAFHSRNPENTEESEETQRRP